MKIGSYNGAGFVVQCSKYKKEKNTMQHRMKTHQLSNEQMRQLLLRTQIGTLATINEDKTPYVTPMHFVYYENAIYAHGLPRGKKLENIAKDNRVGFCVYEMDELLLDSSGRPCDTNTKYESVILSGNASLVDDLELKNIILKELVKKYTPQLEQAELPSKMVKATAIIKIDIGEQTGKYYP